MSQYPTAGPATLADLKQITGMGINQVREAVKQRKLPGKQINGKYVIRWEWITAWLEGKSGFWDATPAPEPVDNITPITSGRQPNRKAS